MVTKNSVVLTEPTVVRGAWPEPIKVVVETGPQPPPPDASRKPAIKPIGAVQIAGASRGTGTFHALIRMKTPMRARYIAMKGRTTAALMFDKIHAPSAAP